MYQEQTTYVKGSLVLHMIRHFLGEADFDRMIAAYLKKHEFSSVDSADLKEAIERAAGRNLTWFFEDWVVGGGGHPRFEVSYRWSPERKQVDLTVKQIQADLPFENEFRLPVEVEIADADGAKTHPVELSGWSTTVALPAETRPTRVTFDKGGWLVCEVAYARPITEVLAELSGGDLAAKLRAARQLADDFGNDPRSVEALTRILADPSAHWGLKQEAALDLGRIGGSAGAAPLVKALGNPDPRVRRAVALALGEAGEVSAAEALRRAIETDRAEDVVAGAEISLGRLKAPGAKEYLTRQLSRDSRWWDSVRIGALIGLSQARRSDARRGLRVLHGAETRRGRAPGGAERLGGRGAGRSEARGEPADADLRPQPQRAPGGDPETREAPPRRGPGASRGPDEGPRPQRRRVREGRDRGDEGVHGAAGPITFQESSPKGADASVNGRRA